MEILKLKVAHKMIGLIDIPYLYLKLDSDKVMNDINALGDIASITTFAQHISTIRTALESKCPKITTLINYPNGDFNTYNVIQEAKQAIAAGTDEIDLIFPFQALVNRQAGLCLQFLQKIKDTTEDTPIKLTIEAGTLQETKWVRKASELAVRSGMNFIKTTSGRNRQAITPTMISTIFNVIEDMNPDVGFHIQTSNNNFLEASSYLEEAINRFGPLWVDANHFRLSGPNLESSISEILSDNHIISSY